MEIDVLEKFQPFSVTIKLNTEEDVKALYAIFNNSRNAELVGEEFASSLCGMLLGRYPKAYVTDNNEIANGIWATEYYK